MDAPQAEELRRRALAGRRLHRGWAESMPVGVRGGLTPEPEVMAERCRVAKTSAFGDEIDGLVCLLEHFLGEQDPLAGEPAQRRGPGLLHEPPGEGPRRHAGPGGELADRDLLVEMTLH